MHKHFCKLIKTLKALIKYLFYLQDNQKTHCKDIVFQGINKVLLFDKRIINIYFRGKHKYLFNLI